MIMFKLIFRTILIIFILIVIIVALAVWKGGDSFRWIGKKTESVGRAICGFGDIVDGVKKGKKKAEKTLKELKEKDKGENGTINNRKRPE